MKKEEFQALAIQEQVWYINKQMEEGETLTNACISVGLTKELSRKFQKNGYKLIDKQFIPPNQPPQTQEVAIDTITPPKVKEVKKVQETKKIGRPLKKFETKKLTLEVERNLHRALKFYCVDMDVCMNEYISKLLRENIPIKYTKI